MSAAVRSMQRVPVHEAPSVVSALSQAARQGYVRSPKGSPASPPQSPLTAPPASPPASQLATQLASAPTSPLRTWSRPSPASPLAGRGASAGVGSAVGLCPTGNDIGCGISMCQAKPWKDVASGKYSYVGEGKGGYQCMPNYQFVGCGQGSYDKQTVAHYTGWQFRRCCLVLTWTVPLLVLLACCIVWAQSDPSPAAGVATSTAVNATTANMSSALENRSKAGQVKGIVLGAHSGSNDSGNHSTNHSRKRRNDTHKVSSSSKPYNCSNDEDTSSWTEGRLFYCCTVHSKGCPASTTTTQEVSSTTVSRTSVSSTLTETSTTEVHYDCSSIDADTPLPQRVWCCLRKQVDCPTQRPPEGRDGSTHSTTGKPGEPDGPATWGTQASSTTAPPTNQVVKVDGPCGKECSFFGFTNSCLGHIRFSQQKWFDNLATGCSQAHELLLGYCPVCGRCSVQAAGCPGGAEQAQASATPLPVPPAAAALPAAQAPTLPVQPTALAPAAAAVAAPAVAQKPGAPAVHYG